MFPINYKKVRFENDNDVFAMAYKKPSVKNCFTMFKGERLGLGILYIAAKNAMVFKDIIQIKIPYSKLKELPKDWLNLIEFYKFGVSMRIYKILYKGL